jgi:ketosteroid isomerase-like protein
VGDARRPAARRALEGARPEWRVRARTARGIDYDNAYCGIFTVRDGRIAAVREYLDSAYAAQALFDSVAA